MLGDLFKIVLFLFFSFLCHGYSFIDAGLSAIKIMIIIVVTLRELFSSL